MNCSCHCLCPHIHTHTYTRSPRPIINSIWQHTSLENEVDIKIEQNADPHSRHLAVCIHIRIYTKRR